MSMQENLRALAAVDAPAAPYGFEAFEQRRTLAAVQRRNTWLGAAGSIAALGVVSILALVTQAPPQLQMAETGPVEFTAATDSSELPALVNLDQFDLTTELEDHIAVLDAELSMARVAAAPAEQLRQLESTRRQLNESLQRVSYAHSLLNL
jgi:hypothetical protein